MSSTPPTPQEQLAIIKQLEEKLGKTIPKLNKAADEIEYKDVGYTLNENSNINGLSLYKCGIQNEHLRLIGGLSSLSVLYLSSNQISKIEGLEGLNSLSWLILWSNQISQIEGLEKLSSLSKLDLSSNQISKIEGLEGLNSLSKLDLESNQITDTTPIKDLIQKQREGGGPVLEVSSSTTLGDGKVTLGNNPLKTPPMEVVDQGTEAFLRWFEEATLTTRTVKVSLLGNTRVGKSNLVNCLNLQDQTDQEIQKTLKNFQSSNPSTDIIRIVPQNYSYQIKDNNAVKRNATVYFYDFGGQEHFHGTYNLFLGGGQEGGLVVLLATKKSENLPYCGTSAEPEEISLQDNQGRRYNTAQSLLHFPPSYWLAIIRKKFAQTCTTDPDVKSKLLVVQNQTALHPGDLKTVFHKHKYQMDLKKPNRFFDNWKRFRTDLQRLIQEDLEDRKVTPTYQGLLELIDGLEQETSDNQIGLEELYDKFWEEAGSELQKELAEEEARQKSFMDALVLLAMTGRIIFLDLDNIKSSDKERLRYLNQLPNTKVFFNPEQVTLKIAQILDWHRLVQEKKDQHLHTEIGTFCWNDIEHIPEVDDYLEILEKEKIVYTYQNTNQNTVYVAPQYLPHWTELTEGQKRPIENIKNTTREQDIETLFSDLIEPSFMVKLISSFLNNLPNASAYNNGFYYRNDQGFDIVVTKDGQQTPEDKARLTIYFKQGNHSVQELKNTKINTLKEIHAVAEKTKTRLLKNIETGELSLVVYIQKLENNISAEAIAEDIRRNRELAEEEVKIKEKLKKKWWQKISKSIWAIIVFVCMGGAGTAIVTLTNLPETISYNWNKAFANYSLACQQSCEIKHNDPAQNPAVIKIDSNTFKFDGKRIIFDATIENANGYILTKDKIHFAGLSDDQKKVDPMGNDNYTIYLNLNLHQNSDSQKLAIENFEPIELWFDKSLKITQSPFLVI